MKTAGYASIVLFVSDNIGQLEKCLCHILDYTPSQQYELIVVETMDCAEMHEYVSGLPNIQVLAYAPDMSAGARYKTAAGLATGMNIVFLYDWALLYDRWLVALYSALADHQNAAVVQPFLGEDDYSVDQEDLKIDGGCFLISRQVLQAAGGFDGCYFTEFMCLADLAYRIFRSKKRIVNVAACQVDCSAWNLFSVNQDLYLQDSERYKKRYGFSFIYCTHSREELVGLLDYKKPDVNILDIGCACGANLLLIKNANPSAKLYGLELCEPAAEVASNFADVKVADFEKFEQDDFCDKFDYIIMGDVLEHLFDTDKALQKVWKWLRPGGELVVSVPNVSHVSVIADALEGKWIYADSGILDRTHVRFFTRMSMRQCLQENNFFVKNMHRAIINYGEGELANQLMDTLVKLPLLKIDRKDLETYQIVYLAEKRVNR